LKRFLFALLALNACTYAVPITFTLQGTASGIANGGVFAGKSFTVTYSSDTSFLLPNDTVEVYPPAITSFNIAGIGNGTFAYFFFLHTRVGTSFVNLMASTGNANFLLIYPGLAKYPFLAAFGPVSVVLDPKTPLPQNLPSTLGNISFTSLDNLTFGAATPTVPPAPTPIPSTLVLAVTGLAGAALLFGLRGKFAHGLPSPR
jgi:hypothetical protein